MLVTPSTIDRVLATLRHAAKWIHKQQPFAVGNPMTGIKDTSDAQPAAWRGLKQGDRKGEPNEVLRLKSAAEQLITIQTRRNQYPYRNYALLMTGLNSALRPSELLALNLAQYDGQAFLRVVCKGNLIVSRIPLGKEARDAINDYIEQERGEEDGPLFQSKTGRNLTIQKYDQALKNIAAHANARLKETEKIHVSPHVLRHTGLRKLCREKGIEFAKKRSNHVSDRHIWRYIQPDEAEFDEAIEEL